MSIPTIASISPVIGHTGGGAIITIEGTGFRLPEPGAEVDGITPAPPPSVLVTFGGVPARAVAVAATTLIFATTEIGDPTDPLGLPADVVVTNIDDSGVPIPGETFTLVQSWRYVRPNITDVRSDLVRVIDAFVAELERQVIPNVTWPASTDFDPDTSDTLSIIDVPSFPGLIVAAVEMTENAEYSLRGQQDYPNPDDPDGFLTLKPPDTVDITFTLVGVSDSTKELMNLSAVMRRFFKINPRLTMARDPDDASKGTVAYELDAHDAPKVKLTLNANTNNVRSFAMTAAIKGFDIESIILTDIDGNQPAQSEAVTEVGKTLDGDLTLSIEPKP